MIGTLINELGNRMLGRAIAHESTALSNYGPGGAFALVDGASRWLIGDGLGSKVDGLSGH